MRRYAAGAGCLMQFLQLALDDPDPRPCGRCSVCTGELPPPGTNPDVALVASVHRFARGVDTVIEPRKLWPTGLASVSGRIVGCEPGRALAFADDPGWAEEMARFDAVDAEIDGEIGNGLVEVMRRWRTSWSARPVAVVPMPSRRNPRRVRSAAEHIAAVGKLPLLDVLTAGGPPPPTDQASGARVGALLTGLQLAADAHVPAGPLLLVDDTYRSGWTMTVAASVLRNAGATTVLPLVVHQLP
jgi:ATP-dependent DNA helicase RecQ